MIYRLLLHFQTEFNYSSPYWTNKQTYAVENGLEGLTEKQTKLASYWNAPFDKICLGMKVDGVTKWILINHDASSLFNVISGGVSKDTTAGMVAWRSLMDSSLLEQHCNQEGLNLQPPGLYGSYVKVRIGLAADNYESCGGYDSCIGFGTSASSCKGYDLTSPSCGTTRIGCNDNPNKKKPAFGYMLVQ